MKSQITKRELLLELGITEKIISNAICIFFEEKTTEKMKLWHSPDKKNIILLESIFSEKIFSEKEKKIILEMIDFPSYKEALKFSRDFPNLWKIAKEIIKIYDIIWFKKRTKQNIDFIDNLCLNPTVKEIIITERISCLWEYITEKKGKWQDLVKELKKILLEKPAYKNYLVQEIILETLIFDFLDL